MKTQLTGTRISIGKMGKKRILLGSSYSAIEPLGPLHLGGLARNLGWQRNYILVKDHDFDDFFRRVDDFKPDVVGFNVYTGNHMQLHEAFARLKKDHPGIQTVVGGPHPTYFPAESAEIADFVVMGEGFSALRKILQGEASPGILPMDTKPVAFPLPDRATFYDESPKHAKSPIKSIITMTGCPYTCSYCYNSSTFDDINLPPQVAQLMADTIGMSGRLFPKNVRNIESVIEEAREISEQWPTKMIYVQDDVHGFDTKEWMPAFARAWKEQVGLPYHAQMRWEMTKGSGGDQRLDILKEAGCFGLTLAIEAADPVVRSEVLNRGMSEELMFDGMKKIIDRGLRVRTEQISGLPYGATSVPTPMNLDADIGLIELNVRLREQTGGPTMAWGSTLAPYKGTKLGTYCAQFGFYNGNNSDVPDTFFERSVLRFLRKWVGPDLKNRQHDESVWMNPTELNKYHTQNAELRRLFNFFTLVPQGHVLADTYLRGQEPFSYARLGKETTEHLQSLSKSNPDAKAMLGRFSSMKKLTDKLAVSPDEKRTAHELIPFFSALPLGGLALERFINYGRNNGSLDTQVLGNAVRHHLYDKVLYETESLNTDSKNSP